MILSSTPFHYLEYYPAHNVVVSQWYGRCSSREYRHTLMHFLHTMRDMNIHNAISDRRLLSSVSSEDLYWTAHEFAEEFRTLPLKRFAFINSFDPAAEQQLLQFLHHSLPLPFEIKVFEDLTSAYEWLTSVQA